MANRVYIPIQSCVARQGRLPVGRGCFVVTAVTGAGETPFCDPVCQASGPTPPIPPSNLPCANYYLVNTTESASDFTWDPYPEATGYNVYSASDTDSMNFVLTHSNIPVSVLPIDCESIIVSAITPAGASPACDPIHFCPVGPPIPEGACGPMPFDPASLTPWAWWKADSFPVMADNTAVGGPGLVWEDQSGNGRHATTGQPQPLYRAPGAVFTGPGLPSIQCGIGDNGSFEIPTFTTPGNFTLVFLYKSAPTGVLNVFLGTEVPFPRVADVVYAEGGSYKKDGEFCGSTASPSDACEDGGSFSGNANVAIFRRIGNTLTFFNNGMNLGSVSDACFHTFTRLGGYVAGVQNHPLNGNFGEVFLFDTGVSDSDLLSLVEGYLRPKWCLIDCVA